ncbi:MAG: polyhydroxyalkanoate synthesis repressor PhaR [Pseudomonadota bacterium]|nr:polyhydroxyalkanoate synthesis repressor PhaR [Alphaproteobacteria bacterium]
MTEQETKPDAPDSGPAIIIKKYANRRLYNTATSRYITLEQLSDMVKEGQNFVVHDAKSGEDITGAVLTQIIVEQEAKTPQNLLPVNFLRQLIRMYGDAMQPFVPNYLEAAMETFQKNQDSIREQFSSVFGKVPGLRPLEGIARQNLAMMEKAMQHFSPFQKPLTAKEAQKEADLRTAPKTAETTDEMAQLKARIDAMQKQLDSLGKPDKGRGKP